MQIVKTITLRQALSEIDIYNRNNQLYEFSIGYLVTTGKQKGEINFKPRVSKKKELPETKRIVFFGDSDLTQPIKKKRSQGNHKIQRTLPLYNQVEKQHFKIKISALLYFNSMRIVRPIYDLNHNAFYPKINESGHVIYPK